MLVVLDEGMVVIVLVAVPTFVPPGWSSPPEWSSLLELRYPFDSSWSVTGDNGLITVVRRVTDVVVVVLVLVVVLVVDPAFDFGTLDFAAPDVITAAWPPTWIAAGTFAPLPPVPAKFTKIAAPAAAKIEQSHKLHREPVREDLGPLGRTREAAEIRTASSL